ncbi:F-box and WD domain protein, putative [Entamoeba invadens IP1]|uniref:F-box and WD domain protein, putative n=1 Tax=Entamoeba invadens IP1 TaxID=370355 RepID=A0A0A1UCS0_ENTIV|nr:F-box and WD domain protein, putative [Entamoeba invadens IP1]ELP91463.1 F-box and WD domain protein, putative [Entamoeba invadens IP1]|eukprot:XP_004258234.1 F-box and WD domain protein, putative [Entamoeba invadens IP1]
MKSCPSKTTSKMTSKIEKPLTSPVLSDLEKRCWFKVNSIKTVPLSNPRWEKIEKELDTTEIVVDTYAMQTEGNELFVRSVTGTSLNYILVSNLFHQYRKVLEMFPNFTNILQIDDHTFSAVVFALEPDYCQKIVIEHCCVTTQDECSLCFFNTDKMNNPDDEIFYVTKTSKGCDIIIEGHSKAIFQVKEYFTYFYCIHNKLLTNIYNHLSGDKEAENILNMEKQLYVSMYYIPTFPILYQKNSKFDVYVNCDFSEVVVRGSNKIRDKASVLVNSLHNRVNSGILFPGSTIIKKGKKLLYFHAPFTCFNNPNNEVDFIIGTTVTEGNAFYGCQIVTQKMCGCTHPHSNDKKIFFVELCAEKFSFVNDEIQSYFYYHYFTPAFVGMEENKRNRCMTNLITNKLIIRYAIDYNVPLYVPPVFDDTLSSTQTLLALSVKLQSTIKLHKYQLINKKRNTVYLKYQKCYLQELSDKLLLMVFEYLCLEDVISAMLTCSRFHSKLKTSNLIWSNFNYIHFISLTHNLTNATPEKIDYKNVITKYNKLKAWRHSLPYKRVVISPFYSSINYIMIKQSDSIVVGSDRGYFSCVAIEDTAKTERECMPLQPIAGMKYYKNSTNDLFVYFRSGEMRKYTTKSFQYESFNCNNYNKVVFSYNPVLLGLEHETNIAIYDLNTCSEVLTFSPHSVEITSLKMVDNNLVLTSSLDGTCAGYDKRTNNVVFRTQNHLCGVTVFDYFDNYILSGTARGCVRMWDVRADNFCCDRHIHIGPINTIMCYNRKLVTGGVDKTVKFCRFEKGWFGDLKYLYNHNTPIDSLSLNDDILFSGSQDGTVICTKYNVPSVSFK